MRQGCAHVCTSSRSTVWFGKNTPRRLTGRCRATTPAHAQEKRTHCACKNMVRGPRLVVGSVSRVQQHTAVQCTSDASKQASKQVCRATARSSLGRARKSQVREPCMQGTPTDCGAHTDRQACWTRNPHDGMPTNRLCLDSRTRGVGCLLCAGCQQPSPGGAAAGMPTAHHRARPITAASVQSCRLAQRDAVGTPGMQRLSQACARTHNTHPHA
jgi:hypothetical protein